MKSPKLTDEEKIKIIYNSLDDEERIHFKGTKDKIRFNRYLAYLNFLESLGYIKVYIRDDFTYNKRTIIVRRVVKRKWLS